MKTNTSALVVYTAKIKITNFDFYPFDKHLQIYFFFICHVHTNQLMQKQTFFVRNENVSVWLIFFTNSIYSVL